MTRTEFPRKVKLQAFERCGGACEECGARLYPGKHHYDHTLPVALGGKSDLNNCSCLCEACHGAKTSSEDVPRIRKADRQRAAHLNAKTRESRPMDGSRASGIRKRMDGRVERRT